jgi:hypothetical protein
MVAVVAEKKLETFQDYHPWSSLVNVAKREPALFMAVRRAPTFYLPILWGGMGRGRDRHAHARRTEAYLNQYVEGLSGEHACRRLVVAAKPRLPQKRHE